MPLDPSVATDDYCYLTTTGRTTGRPHEIEIWFGLDGATLYLLSGNGDRSDWVKNLHHSPNVRLRLRDTTHAGAARMMADTAEDVKARTMLVTKYQPRYSGSLDEWGRTALPVAVDLEVDERGVT